jgi:hypothetical protein
MKSIASAIAFCCLFLNVGPAQVKPTAPLEPTPLEAFAHQPTTYVAWSKRVGSLDSTQQPLSGTLCVDSRGSRSNLPWFSGVEKRGLTP